MSSQNKSEFAAEPNVRVTCSKGHVCVYTGAQYSEHGANHTCTVCTCLRKIQQTASYAQSSYNYGDRDLVFTDLNGHRFVANKMRWYCLVCKMIKRLKYCTLVSDNVCNHDTPMRFHCHECNQDFYTTYAELKQDDRTSMCATKHTWNTRAHILRIILALEILSNERFDDPAPVKVNAYNAHMGVACLHLEDIGTYKDGKMSKATKKCLDDTRNWCQENNVLLIEIPAKRIQPRKCVPVIVNHLVQHGFLDSDVQDARAWTYSLQTLINEAKKGSRLLPFDV